MEIRAPKIRPSRVLRPLSAPSFWDTNVDTALPIASNGHIANCLILAAAVIAET